MTGAMPEQTAPSTRPNPTPADRSPWRVSVERHNFDPMALIAGAIFMAIAVMYLLDAHGTVDARPGVTLALAVIGVGASGLAGAVWAMVSRRKRRTAEFTASDTPSAPVDLTK